ncbi:MAG: methylated-DNA--[protein]-cysteine S-methyltransferase [Bacteroidales bacterium]|nr:methylated-DNA--[protein]-cysteine S-methyltransferase [Bacteroidales bacterium]
MEPILSHLYHSPAGELLLASFGGELCLCDWVGGTNTEENLRRICNGLKADIVEGNSTVIEETKHQLDEYFARERRVFEIPLLLVGTEFQKMVWRTLLKIPYGHTISYLQQAQMMGRPKSVRAVANANAHNAISIIVPCHRVIGTNGKLTGYAGGLRAKDLLLEQEGFMLMQS